MVPSLTPYSHYLQGDVATSKIHLEHHEESKAVLKKQNDVTDTNIEETHNEETNLRLVYRTILYFCSDQKAFVGIDM